MPNNAIPMTVMDNSTAAQLQAAEGISVDVSGKADKVTGATAGDLAALDENGNLVDSGKQPEDFLAVPATAGTDGQVLTSDGEGGVSWEDPTGGDPTEIIDDTAGDGDTDKVWSADKTSELLSQKLNAPESAGTAGQALVLDNNLDPVWGDVAIDPEDIAEAVDAWLDDHPEAVTTVQDGAVTEPKLADSLKERIMTYILLNGWNTVNWETGYINVNGTVSSNVSFRHTDYIPVSVGEEISYKLGGYESSVYIVTGYDSSKAKVTGADVVGSTAKKTGVYTVPSGVAYVRLSSGDVSNAEFSSNTVKGTKPQNTQTYIDNADAALSARIANNESELNALDGVQSVKDFYTMSPNMIDPNDLTAYGSGFYWTQYMPVTAGERYTAWCTDAIYLLYWYTSGKTEISNETINATAFERIAPSNAAYVRLVYKVLSTTKAMFAHEFVGDYVPYGILIPIEQMPKYIKRDSNNIFDTHKFARGLSINSNSGYVSAYSNDVVVSYFIPVEEGETYYIGAENDGLSNITGKAAFDEDYAYVETFNSPYTVSEGVAFIRIAFTLTGQYVSPCVRKGMTGVSGLQNFNSYDTFQVVNSNPTAYEQANSLYGLKWNVMGDSITEGNGTTKAYMTFIKNRTGVIPNNYGVSNTAIARTNSSDTNAMSIRYTNMTNDADIITVFGGTNDHGNSIPIGEWGDSTADTLYGAMKILVEGLIGKYMGKRIGFILPLPKYVSSTDYSYPNASFGAYIDCIKDVCKRYSIPYLDLYTESGIAPKIEAVRTAMIPDGLHPNATGHELISWQIQRFLERL